MPAAPDARVRQQPLSGFRHGHNGNALIFVYDNDKIKHLIGLTLPGGSQVGYSYDSDKNLTTITNADSMSRTYLYELTASRKNLLTGITDEVSRSLRNLGLQCIWTRHIFRTRRRR